MGSLFQTSAVNYMRFKLLRKETKFIRSNKCQEVFEKSKCLLLQNQVLEIYDKRKTLVVCADGYYQYYLK